MDSVNVRNLEQIQEDDPKRRPSRLPALILASIGGAALVTVAVMSAKRSGPPATSKDDPLAALVADSKSSASAPPEKLDGTDVSFPKILSDEEAPTTALAAVKDERGRLVEQPGELVLPPGAPTLPPPATDRLPVVPLPAGTLLSATPVTTQPKDSLTELAARASKTDDSTTLAPPGSDGGYQIQVASFKDAPDADAFVNDLRKRGHSAFRQPAYVPDRGLWHRVRIGPFKTKFAAQQYAAKFEKTERVSPFVVDPHKVKQQEEIRAAKLEARKRKSSGQ
jgi:cell division septation protein DedD